MSRHDFKLKDRVRVLIGTFTGGTGRVRGLSDDDVAKCIGCKIVTVDGEGKKTSTFVWFDPDKDEIEKIEKEAQQDGRKRRKKSGKYEATSRQ